jgi:hypothetical protein
MKKLLYIVLVAFVSTLTFTSCTEEEVQPEATSTFSNGGGGALDKN